MGAIEIPYKKAEFSSDGYLVTPEPWTVIYTY
jgi:hypothetical protein